MNALTLSKQTARRFVLGRQGLWPGRRWSGEAGVGLALTAIEAVQLDPLTVVARSHDIALWGRVENYTPAHFDHTIYEQRQGFDYGRCLFIYPMAEMPYRAIAMQRERECGNFHPAARDPAVLAHVRDLLRESGPMRNRDFVSSERVTSYRGRKATAVALYYLWATGEVMVHHRVRFERVYHLRDHVVPVAHDYVAATAVAESYLARKAIAFLGLVTQNSWAGEMRMALRRKIERAEAHAWLQRLVDEGLVILVRIEGSRDTWYALMDDMPLLHDLESGRVPAAWRPMARPTAEEAVFLAPLDIVSARGRANWLFDFQYVWEVYKPVEQRRWGYYTLPVLFGDRLVARIDPRLHRATRTLHIEGFWLDDLSLAASADFALALARGLARFARFLGAAHIITETIQPTILRQEVVRWLAMEE